jgi:uncharacterized membrane protein HdeD (DUF308 family)
VLLEAVSSVALGVVALGSPFQSAHFLHLVALWGLVTGILEILAATRFLHGAAARSFLSAGGAWSIFLAVLVLSLPHALTHELVLVISVYTLVFGILVTVAALGLRRGTPPMAVASVNHSWTHQVEPARLSGAVAFARCCGRSRLPHPTGAGAPS